jgi:hypothetical protein
LEMPLIRSKLNVRVNRRRLVPRIVTLGSRGSCRIQTWELLGKTRVFETIMETNARIYYNAGQQDIGHWIQGEAVRLAPDEYLTMIQENRTDA